MLSRPRSAPMKSTEKPERTTKLKFSIPREKTKSAHLLAFSIFNQGSGKFQQKK
jgi:hypothetical protein